MDDMDVETNEPSVGDIDMSQIDFADETSDHLYPEHIPGSIVRIKFHNFLIYDDCEFYPGPHMNMIIGPNGTGKSTIVCGVALGLGGSANILGRSKNPKDFIKDGREEGYTEIELKDSPKNIVIQRIFSKINTGGYKLNNKTATRDAVHKAVSKHNIQMDNLCQFLPQDRVAHFAQLAPPQLLRETERAIHAEDDLILMHDQLVEKKKSLFDLQRKRKGDQDHLESLKSRQTSMQQDIERFQERQKHLEMVKYIKLKRPWMVYNEARETTEEKKQLREEAKVEKEKYEDENAPLKATFSKLKKLSTKYSEQKRRTGDGLATQKKKLEGLTANIETAEAKVREVQKKITNLSKQERNDRNKLKTYQEEIEKIESNLKEAPSDNGDSLEPKIRQKVKDIEEISEKAQAVQFKKQDIIDNAKNLSAVINETMSKLKKLDDVKDRRLQALKNKQFNGDTFDAVHWLRENQQHFSQPLQVSNPEHAPYVEASINRQILTSFVCQNEADYDDMLQEFDRKKWRCNVVLMPQEQSLDYYKSKIDRNLLKSVGFQATVFDLIEAPEPILLVLCSEAKIHTIPISSKMVDRERVVASRQFAKFATEGLMYLIKWSYYGNQEATVSTKAIDNPRFLGATFNNQHKIDLENKLRESNQKLDENEHNNRKYVEELKKYTLQEQQLKEDKRKLVEKKRELKLHFNNFAKMKSQINLKREQMQSFQESMNSGAKKAQYLKNYQEYAGLRSELVLKYQKLLSRIIELERQSIEHSLSFIQCQNKLVSIERELRDFDDKSHEAKTLYEKAQQEYVAAKKFAVEKLRICEKQGQPSKETGEKFQDLPDSIHELDDMLATETARADMIVDMDDNILKEYEQRNREINQTEQRLESKDAEFATAESDINAIKDVWQPKLQSLVELIGKKFSEFFDGLGCAGEVRLAEDEDYEKWGIEILVKFRNSEELQLLTPQRQSGGERSVSTILYLMSLQELSKSPFRVVDEINQGMDPRNERLVHSQIVETACKPNTSQYFLITPKLLPDLVYNQKMTVLCIFNGEWQPKHEEWKLSEFLTNYRKTVGVM